MSLKSALRLIQSIVAMTNYDIASETVSIPAGAAGTIKNFYISQKPILDANKAFVGGNGSTSLVLTSTAFDTEVPENTSDAELTNGDYWIDYVTGRGRGKKADTSTSMTAAYSVLRRAPGRVLGKSASVASATTITLPQQGNYFIITGTTTIDGIVTAGWTVGSKITLEFTSNVTVTDMSGTPGSGAAALQLSGNYIATDNDILELVLTSDNTWSQTVRSTL